MFNLNYDARPLRLTGLAPNAHVPTVVLDEPRVRFARLTSLITRLFGPRPKAEPANAGYEVFEECLSFDSLG